LPSGSPLDFTQVIHPGLRLLEVKIVGKFANYLKASPAEEVACNKN